MFTFTFDEVPLHNVLGCQFSEHNLVILPILTINNGDNVPVRLIVKLVQE